jgi:hypothetical protein
VPPLSIRLSPCIRLYDLSYLFVEETLYFLGHEFSGDSPVVVLQTHISRLSAEFKKCRQSVVVKKKRVLEGRSNIGNVKAFSFVPTVAPPYARLPERQCLLCVCRNKLGNRFEASRRPRNMCERGVLCSSLLLDQDMLMRQPFVPSLELLHCVLSAPKVLVGLKVHIPS